jgi:hypothetical protein
VMRPSGERLVLSSSHRSRTPLPWHLQLARLPPLRSTSGLLVYSK